MNNSACSPAYCPFSHGVCTECAIYRGRHRYMSFSQKDDIGKNGNGTKDHIADYFRGMEALSNPWAERSTMSKEELSITLVLIDAETGKRRNCELSEAQTWDWGDPETMRIINDRQVVGFQHLVDILCHKELEGEKEVAMYQFPRFMFLCGG